VDICGPVKLKVGGRSTVWDFQFNSPEAKFIVENANRVGC